MKLWLTLLFLWIAWKVLSAVLEELGQRKRRQSGSDDQGIRPRTARQAPGADRIPDRQARRTPSPEQAENELERLLRDAMEQRRRRQAPPVPEPVESVRVEPRPVEAARPEAAFPQAEPAPSGYRVEYRQAPRKVRPVAQEAALGAQAQERKVAVAARRPAKRRAQAREQTEPAHCAFVKQLGREELRKGIILSEILGPPKALKDIFDPGPNVLYQ